MVPKHLSSSYPPKETNAAGAFPCVKVACSMQVFGFFWFYLLRKTIVIRGDWFWKATNIKYIKKLCCSLCWKLLKVHNPLFSVGQLWRNKLMGPFHWSIRSKLWECRLNFVHRQVHKDIWQRRLTGFIHPLQITNYGKTCEGKKTTTRFLPLFSLL